MVQIYRGAFGPFLNLSHKIIKLEQSLHGDVLLWNPGRVQLSSNTFELPNCSLDRGMREHLSPKFPHVRSRAYRIIGSFTKAEHMHVFFHLICWYSPGEERSVKRELEIMMVVKMVWRKVCILPGSRASVKHISAIATIVGMKTCFSKFTWDCGVKYLASEKYLEDYASFGCYHVTWNSMSNLKQPQKAEGTSPTPVLSIQSFLSSVSSKNLQIKYSFLQSFPPVAKQDRKFKLQTYFNTQ